MENEERIKNPQGGKEWEPIRGSFVRDHQQRVHQAVDQDQFQASRLNAKMYLDERIKRLSQKLYYLEEFRKMLPTELTPQQDLALWEVLSTREL